MDELGGFINDENLSSGLGVNEVLGRKFDSISSAWDFYKAYGYVKGFSVRRSTTRYDKKRNIVSQEFCCGKEGHRRSGLQHCDRQRKARPISRIDCNAKVRVRMKEAEVWIITYFDDKHNHPMCNPNQKPFLLSQRAITDADLTQAKAMKSVGVRTSQIYNYFMQEKGGFQNVGFVDKDLYNALHASDQKEIEHGDVNSVVSYFHAKKDSDMGFYMEYSTDDEMRLHNLFWADSTSRSDYSCFGDVIAFDTTYKKNAYGRPLMPIVGVNHHHQTVLFGVAILADETADTFEWVLRTLLDAMNNKPPISVVTDGDRAMARAIKTIIPGARHRLCTWHLSRNAQANISDPLFTKAFTRCMKEWWTPHEFDQEWTFMVRQFNVEDHPWVIEKGRTRVLWAQAYMRGHFFGTLTTTQRCESMNASLAIYLKSKRTYLDFVRAIDQGHMKMRMNESRAEYSTMHTTPNHCSSLTELEGHAAEVYTRKSFSVFQLQLARESLYRLREPVVENNSTRIFYLGKYKYPNRRIKVEYDVVSRTIHCDCQHFETVGFPCRHQLCVLKLQDMTRLPESLIMHRWTKMAKLSVPSFVAVEVDPEIIQRLRFASLSSRANRMNYIASLTDDSFKRLSGDIDRLTSELEESCKLTDPISKNTSTPSVRDPARKKSKGKQVMKTSYTVRKCTNCKREGHNKATCPDLDLMLGTGMVGSYSGWGEDERSRFLDQEHVRLVLSN